MNAETSVESRIGESILRLTYTVQEADLAVATAVAQQALAPLARGRWLVTALSAGVGVFIGAALVSVVHFGTWERDNWGHLSAVLFSLAALLTWILAQRVGLNVARRLALHVSGPYPMEQWLSVGPDGMRFGDEYAECRCAWAAVQEVRECREHVAILTTGCIVQLVPHSAFPSKEAIDAFVVYIRQKSSGATR